MTKNNRPEKVEWGKRTPDYKQGYKIGTWIAWGILTFIAVVGLILAIWFIRWLIQTLFGV